MKGLSFVTSVKKSPIWITGMTLFAFLTLFIGGMLDCTNPIMQRQMKMESARHAMTDCMSGVIGGMDIGEHLSIWQSIFTIDTGVNAAHMLAALIAVVFFYGAHTIALSRTVSSSLSRYLYYERDHPNHALHNRLIGIFASGIIQPKLYA